MDGNYKQLIKNDASIYRGKFMSRRNMLVIFSTFSRFYGQDIKNFLLTTASFMQTSNCITPFYWKVKLLREGTEVFTHFFFLLNINSLPINSLENTVSAISIAESLKIETVLKHMSI